jgi:biotin carboxyl carrier protein
LPSDQATLAGLVGDLLPALITRLDASELGELEVRGGGWRVRLRRPYDRRRPVVAADGRRRRQHPAHAPSAAAGVGGGEQAGGAPRETATAGAGTVAGVPSPSVSYDATSPAVGYYLPRDGIITGRAVQAGDVLGYVDCLGVRHDVVAPVDGVIGTSIAQVGEAVEYGQALVHVDLVAAPSASEGVVESEPGPGAFPGAAAAPPASDAGTAAMASPAGAAPLPPGPDGRSSARMEASPPGVPAAGSDGRESSGPGAVPTVTSNSSAAPHGTA